MLEASSGWSRALPASFVTKLNDASCGKDEKERDQQRENEVLLGDQQYPGQCQQSEPFMVWTCPAKEKETGEDFLAKQGTVFMFSLGWGKWKGRAPQKKMDTFPSEPLEDISGTSRWANVLPEVKPWCRWTYPTFLLNRVFISVWKSMDHYHWWRAC